MKSKISIFLIVLTFVLISKTICDNSNELNKNLDFPNYVYKKSSQLENKFLGNFNKCNLHTECASIGNSADRQNCALKCLSNECFIKIYASNPLEEGEIDQRIQSFKGCYALNN